MSLSFDDVEDKDATFLYLEKRLVQLILENNNA